MNLGNDDMGEILGLMVKAGFEEVFVGIESVNSEALTLMNKRQNSGDLGKKVAAIQRAGLAVTAGFIIGNDGEESGVGENFNALYGFIQENGIVIPMPGLLTAIRGTRLYRRLQTEDRLREESSGSNTHRFRFNFQPLGDESALVEGYVGLLERLFSSRNYFDRCRRLRERLGGGQLRASRIKWSSFLAMARVFFHYLVKQPDLEFVRFVAETLVKAPKEFPETVAEAVKLVHFQEITANSILEYRHGVSRSIG